MTDFLCQNFSCRCVPSGDVDLTNPLVRIPLPVSPLCDRLTGGLDASHRKATSICLFHDPSFSPFAPYSVRSQKEDSDAYRNTRCYRVQLSEHPTKL